MAFTGAKKRSIYEIQINQCTFFWRCNSGNVDFFHCDGGDGTLVVWGVICLIGLLSRPLSLPWWWLWGSHSNALDGMKCVFITKNKYFFLQKKVLFFAKRSTFFCKKKYFFLAKKSTSRHVLFGAGEVLYEFRFPDKALLALKPDWFSQLEVHFQNLNPLPGVFFVPPPVCRPPNAFSLVTMFYIFFCCLKATETLQWIDLIFLPILQNVPSYVRLLLKINGPLFPRAKLFIHVLVESNPVYPVLLSNCISATVIQQRCKAGCYQLHVDHLVLHIKISRRCGWSSDFRKLVAAGKYEVISASWLSV